MSKVWRRAGLTGLGPASPSRSPAGPASCVWKRSGCIVVTVSRREHATTTDMRHMVACMERLHAIAARVIARMNAGPIPALGTGGESPSSPAVNRCSDAVRGAGMANKKPAARRPKPTDGGSCLLAGGRETRGNRTADTIALTSRDEVGGGPYALGRQAAPAGPKRGGERVAGNVIHLRPRPSRTGRAGHSPRASY